MRAANCQTPTFAPDLATPACPPASPSIHLQAKKDEFARRPAWSEFHDLTVETFRPLDDAGNTWRHQCQIPRRAVGRRILDTSSRPRFHKSLRLSAPLPRRESTATLRRMNCHSVCRNTKAPHARRERLESSPRKPHTSLRGRCAAALRQTASATIQAAIFADAD